MKAYTKRDFPVDQICRFLEPSPVVLVSSAYKDDGLAHGDAIQSILDRMFYHGQEHQQTSAFFRAGMLET